MVNKKEKSWPPVDYETTLPEYCNQPPLFIEVKQDI